MLKTPTDSQYTALCDGSTSLPRRVVHTVPESCYRSSISSPTPHNLLMSANQTLYTPLLRGPRPPSNSQYPSRIVHHSSSSQILSRGRNSTRSDTAIPDTRELPPTARTGTLCILPPSRLVSATYPPQPSRDVVHESANAPPISPQHLFSSQRVSLRSAPTTVSATYGPLSRGPTHPSATWSSPSERPLPNSHTTRTHSRRACISTPPTLLYSAIPSNSYLAHLPIHAQSRIHSHMPPQPPTHTCTSPQPRKYTRTVTRRCAQTDILARTHPYRPLRTGAGLDDTTCTCTGSSGAVRTCTRRCTVHTTPSTPSTLSREQSLQLSSQQYVTHPSLNTAVRATSNLTRTGHIESTRPHSLTRTGDNAGNAPIGGSEVMPSAHHRQQALPRETSQQFKKTCDDNTYTDVGTVDDYAESWEEQCNVGNNKYTAFMSSADCDTLALPPALPQVPIGVQAPESLDANELLGSIPAPIPAHMDASGVSTPAHVDAKVNNVPMVVERAQVDLTDGHETRVPRIEGEMNAADIDRTHMDATSGEVNDGQRTCVDLSDITGTHESVAAVGVYDSNVVGEEVRVGGSRSNRDMSHRSGDADDMAVAASSTDITAPTLTLSPSPTHATPLSPLSPPLPVMSLPAPQLLVSPLSNPSLPEPALPPSAVSPSSLARGSLMQCESCGRWTRDRVSQMLNVRKKPKCGGKSRRLNSAEAALGGSREDAVMQGFLLFQALEQWNETVIKKKPSTGVAPDTAMVVSEVDIGPSDDDESIIEIGTGDGTHPSQSIGNGDNNDENASKTEMIEGKMMPCMCRSSAPYHHVWQGEEYAGEEVRGVGREPEQGDENGKYLYSGMGPLRSEIPVPLSSRYIGAVSWREIEQEIRGKTNTPEKARKSKMKTSRYFQDANPRKFTQTSTFSSTSMRTSASNKYSDRIVSGRRGYIFPFFSGYRPLTSPDFRLRYNIQTKTKTELPEISPNVRNSEQFPVTGKKSPHSPRVRVGVNIGTATATTITATVAANVNINGANAAGGDPCAGTDAGTSVATDATCVTHANTGVTVCANPDADNSTSAIRVPSDRRAEELKTPGEEIHHMREKSSGKVELPYFFRERVHSDHVASIQPPTAFYSDSLIQNRNMGTSVGRSNSRNESRTKSRPITRESRLSRGNYEFLISHNRGGLPFGYIDADNAIYTGAAALMTPLTTIPSVDVAYLTSSASTSFTTATISSAPSVTNASTLTLSPTNTSAIANTTASTTTSIAPLTALTGAAEPIDVCQRITIDATSATSTDAPSPLADPAANAMPTNTISSNSMSTTTPSISPTGSPAPLSSHPLAAAL